MKKDFLFLLMALSVALGSLTSCSDDETASTIETKPWPYESDVDERWNPGDNFYYYVNGKWADTVDSYVLMQNVSEEQKKALASLDYPALRKVRNDMARVSETINDQRNTIKSMLRDIDNLSTERDAWAYYGSLVAEGCDPILTQIGIKDDVYTLVLSFKKAVTSIIPNDADYENLDFDEEKISEMKTRIEKAIQYLSGQTPQTIVYRSTVDFNEELDLVGLCRTRSDDEDDEDAFLESLGVDVDHFEFNGYASLDLFLAFDELSLEDKKAYLSAIVISNYASLCSGEEIDESRFRYQYMNYYDSKAYLDKYVTDEHTQRIYKLCLEIKSVFSSRIQRLTWMSNTTKSAALDKLSKMSINVFHPDKWDDDALAELPATNNLLDDVRQLKRQKVAYLVSFTGLSYLKRQMDCFLSEDPTYSVNAFYTFMNNSINIFAPLTLPPLVDYDYSEAILYGTIAAYIGHEMTHGFDNSGCMYDAQGHRRDWWTINDRMEYNLRTEKLVTCYNQLQICPQYDPDLYCNGTNTLGENIADLGGFLMAMEAYSNKLKSEGYKDAEYDKQIKRMMQTFAIAYREQRSYSAYLKNSTDVHAQGKERVNGVMMNVDEWYSLYDVNSSNILYLSPERRTYIW